MICVHLFGFESGLQVGEPREFILYILSHAGFPLNALWEIMALLNLVPSGLFFLDKEGSQHILKHLIKLRCKISLVSLGQNHKAYYEIQSKYCCQN